MLGLNKGEYRMLASLHKQQLKMPRLYMGRKKKWTYFSLSFTVFYFVPLFFTPQLSTTAIVLSVVLYVAFIASYLWTGQARSPIVGIALLVSITTCSVFFNTGGYTLFGYSAFILAYYFDVRKAAVFSIIILLIASLQQFLWWQVAWVIFGQCILVSFGLFGFGMMERKETLHQIAQQQSKDEIKQISIIAERERIGRDLHDVAGHALSSISLKAQLAAKLMEKNQYALAKEEVLALASLSQDLLAQVRKSVSGIKYLSLSDEFEKLLNQLRVNNIHVVRDIVPALLSGWHSTPETQVALIAKEAITNILRHSNANTVFISLQLANKRLCLVIHDNGTAKQFAQSGNGLLGMQERATLIGGQLELNTCDGYKLELSFPQDFINTQ
jgi:two-component system sensor histidine kinase DesK